jgi:hypothetical protein
MMSAASSDLKSYPPPAAALHLSSDQDSAPLTAAKASEWLSAWSVPSMSTLLHSLAADDVLPGFPHIRPLTRLIAEYAAVKTPIATRWRLAQLKDVMAVQVDDETGAVLRVIANDEALLYDDVPARPHSRPLSAAGAGASALFCTRTRPLLSLLPSPRPPRPLPLCVRGHAHGGHSGLGAPMVRAGPVPFGCCAGG